MEIMNQIKSILKRQIISRLGITISLCLLSFFIFSQNSPSSQNLPVFKPGIYYFHQFDASTETVNQPPVSPLLNSQQPNINLRLPQLTHHVLIHHPVIGHDFSLEVSPIIKINQNRLNNSRTVTMIENMKYRDLGLNRINNSLF